MTEQLVNLPVVSQLSPRIFRILGGNPGKFTLQGTNTYLLSTPFSSAPSDEASTSSIPCILVDTGEGMASYTAALEKVLRGQDEQVGSFKRHISDIILTHRHHDHVGGLSSVLTLLSETQSRPPRLHKYPDATDEGIIKQLKNLSSSMYEADDTSSPLRPLQDGDRLHVDSSSGTEEKTTLQVVHTPGHTSDHICLLLHQEGALLTGDHVLGQGTSVFEDLGSYLSSLQKCSALLNDISSASEEARLYPAHGPTIEQGKKALKEYLAHRIERENQVLELLATTPATLSGDEDESPNGWTIKNIVSTLYSNYPEHLYPAAARGIFLHLQKLAQPDAEAVQRGVISNGSLQGRRVECIGDGAGVDGQAPKMPSGDAEWFKVMSLQWKLLDKASSNGATAATSQSIEKGSL